MSVGNFCLLEDLPPLSLEGKQARTEIAISSLTGEYWEDRNTYNEDKLLENRKREIWLILYSDQLTKTSGYWQIFMLHKTGKFFINIYIYMFTNIWNWITITKYSPFYCNSYLKTTPSLFIIIILWLLLRWFVQHCYRAVICCDASILISKSISYIRLCLFFSYGGSCCCFPLFLLFKLAKGI